MTGLAVVAAGWRALRPAPVDGPAAFVETSAHDTDVMCRNVTGFFRDGQTMELFHGVLPAGRENIIHMIPVHRDIKRVDFHCRALNGAGMIDVAANIAGRLIIVDHPAIVSEVVTTPPAIALSVPVMEDYDYMVAEDD